MNYFKSAALVGVLISLLGYAAPVSADHAWGNYHWARDSNPLALLLGDNLDTRWGAYLDLASLDWNLSEVLDTTVGPGSTKPRQCKTSVGNVQVCNDRYGYNGWLGIAGIAVEGDHITASYVKLNDNYFDTATYDSPDWRRLVMCQEVGHAFGLGHQDEAFDNPNLNTCMDYTDDPSTNTLPNTHDYDELAGIYAHLDQPSGGTGGDTGDSGCNPRSPKCNGSLTAADILAAIEMNGPAQWGRLVSEHGPVEVYELDFGKGRKIITHVTWTLERARDHAH